MVQTLPIMQEILNQKLENIFGSDVSVQSWNRLTGGARKQVIRLQLSGGLPDLVLLVWQNEQDYFGEREDLASDRSDQKAPLLYQANTDLLLSSAVRVPVIYYFDPSRTELPNAYALVEYVQAVPFYDWQPGRSLEEIRALFGKVSACLDRMSLIQRETYGNLLDESSKPVPCHELALKEAVQGLAGLTEAFEEVRSNQYLVERKLQDLFRAVRPRKKYSFIHDELGPEEHLLIDQKDDIVLIDVDGCHYFDLEREHAYLKLRFGTYYEHLKRDDLDEDRMRFYTFCLHIVAAYGHYRLFQKGFPNPEMLRGIVEWNIQSFLRLSLS